MTPKQIEQLKVGDRVEWKYRYKGTITAVYDNVLKVDWDNSCPGTIHADEPDLSLVNN